MIGKKIIETRPATVSEVAEVLSERKGDGELGFEQQATLEYAEKFSKLKKEKSGKLKGELAKMEKISADAAAKIADLMPKRASELTLIFAKERYSLNDKEAEEIISIVEKYR